MSTNGNAQRETLRQKRERIERERAQVREQAAAARRALPAQQKPQAAGSGDWSFEDEEAVGGDVISPIACEFVLNLLENVAPSAINAGNRALLDVLRTKVRRAVVRGRGALLVDLHREEPSAKDLLVAAGVAKPEESTA